MMPIPTPKKDETEKKYIPRCMHAIGDEYDDKKQAVAVCYNTLRKAHGGKPKKPSEAKIAELLEMAKRPVHTQLAPFPFIAESFEGDVLKIKGVAAVTGWSRNSVYYSDEELEKFASNLKGAPIYIEHVSVFDAIGKVTKTKFVRGEAVGTLYYEGEIYESDAIAKIRRGIVKHVSISADYRSFDKLNGVVPHDFFNGELSLVAVAGIPQANVQINERLRLAESLGVPKEELDRMLTHSKSPMSELNIKTKSDIE